MSLLRLGEKDPRHMVTADAFGVAEELLGRPLAPPWRRGVALLADLLCVFFLTQLGVLSASLVATIVFLILVFQRPIERRWLRWARRVLATGAALPVFLVVLIALSWSMPGSDGFMNPRQWIEFGNALGTQDPETQAKAMHQMAEEMAAAGADAEDLQEIIDTFGLPPGVEVDMGSLVSDGASTEPKEPALSPEEMARLLEDYAAALRAGEKEKAAELGQKTEELIAAGPIGRLEQRIERLRANSRELQSENLELRNEVQHPGFMRVFKGLAADLGLTFGWSGVYFTFFLAWWRGQTPGKRLFGIRVIRLDHRPLGLWSSFERFAGYAAGLATGLFGFVQILWDPNRQGIQDKIVGTVVVFERQNTDARCVANT